MENFALKISGDLRKQYPQKIISIGIEHKFKYGEIVGLMGPSGVGKTTLCSIMAAMLRPEKGFVQFRIPQSSKWLTWGAQKWEKNKIESIRERFGFVFQDATLISRLNCIENILLPLLLKRNGYSFKNAEKDAEDWMKMFGLTTSEIGSNNLNNKPLAKLYPHEISGGQRRRIALLRAMIGMPNILFADEPTSGLDELTAQSIMDCLKLWIDKNPDERLIIFITHSTYEVEYLADRYLCFKNGRLESYHV